MDKPISVGDLVVFVRSCCDGFRDGVTIFRVTHIMPTRSAPRCSRCYGPLPVDRYAADAPHGGAPLQWLKRIPPLDELESEKREEEIPA